jgi:hypothetical protein
MWSVPCPYNEGLLVFRSDWTDRIGEFGRVLESRQSKVIEQEMGRRLHSDLK